MPSHCKKILIDAICPDEIRVAALHSGKVIEFEQEIKGKKQSKGNIYVALVKRIEPSLQAVFIEYGKNKQGFLPFCEISPSYYHLPEDEKKLLLEQFYSYTENAQSNKDSNNNVEQNGSSCSQTEALDSDNNENNHFNNIEEDLPTYKKYKLQDVIKLNQKILVQLTKEVRSHKGASFSTYITLVGRYCVLMPNSSSRGGVSRRIEDADARKYLQEILDSIQLQERTGLIIRTAGAFKKKEEIEQDYNNLYSMWQKIQNNIANIKAPALVYNEADIITRSLRDFCDDQVNEIIVSGKEAYEVVKEYVKLLKNKLRTKLYKGGLPIFSYYEIEQQISELYNNVVELPSGGYLVITPTEALVSIDVNSGKMTGENSIEETAYKTNMEAVQELARQVNLRGLSGLIVIDFIDMAKYQYCRAVESAIKQAFKNDKAKIQFGHINSFGLMEISRQRVKQSILEANTVECFYCKGIGKIKSMEVIALSILRNLKYAADRNQYKIFNLYANHWVIVYIFNNKRNVISEIEKEYNILLCVDVDNNLDIDDFYFKQGGDIRANDNYGDPLVSGCIVDKNGQENQKRSSNIFDNVDKITNTEKSKSWLTKWLLRLLKSQN